MPQFIKFPSINRFRHAIKGVSDRIQYIGKDPDTNERLHDRTIPVPCMDAIGTTKIHGTNASIIFNRRTAEMWSQSRTRIIRPEFDNQGFASFVETHNKEALEMMEQLGHELDRLYPDMSTGDTDNDIIGVFGEWCGGNIQTTVGMRHAPRTFVVFEVVAHGDKWYDDSFKALKSASFVRTIAEFGTFHVEIDFAHPTDTAKMLMDLTLGVEKECPVASKLAPSDAVSKVGEGIVWRLYWPEDTEKTRPIRFKVKGVEHVRRSRKQRKAARESELVETEPELVNSIKEFVDLTMTDARLYQGLEHIEHSQDSDRRNVGQYIKWIRDDIIKEESDILERNNLTFKQVSKQIGTDAKIFFFTEMARVQNLV